MNLQRFLARLLTASAIAVILVFQSLSFAVSCWVWTQLDGPYYDFDCSKGSNLSCTGPIKQYNDSWFHYKTETCGLKVKNVIDRDWDDRRGGWTSDKHDHSKCRWYGKGVNGISGIAIGHTATWDMHDIGVTSDNGVLIEFEMDDYANDPSPACSGCTANDDKARFSIKMFAFEAIAYMSCTSSNSGDPSVTLYETTGGTRTLSLSLTESKAIADEDGEQAEIDAFGAAGWSLSTNPAGVTLSSGGHLKADISATASGDLVGYVDDSDLFDDASVKPGTIDIDIDIGEDDSEGAAGADFAFYSNTLGGDTNDKLRIKSSDYDERDLPALESAAYSYSSGFQAFRSPITPNATANVEGRAICEESGSPAQAYVATTGEVQYSVKDPTYEGGTLHPNPDY